MSSDGKYPVKADRNVTMTHIFALVQCLLHINLINNFVFHCFFLLHRIESRCEIHLGCG